MGVQALPRLAARVWKMTMRPTSSFICWPVSRVRGTKIKRATSLVTSMDRKKVSQISTAPTCRVVRQRENRTPAAFSSTCSCRKPATTSIKDSSMPSTGKSI